MNSRLVMCLFAAIPVGLAAAGWALLAGWHPLLALAAYSLAGSMALVAFALAAASRPAPRPSAPPTSLLPTPHTALRLTASVPSFSGPPR